MLERNMSVNVLLLKRYWLGVVGMELSLVCALVLYKYGNRFAFKFLKFIGSISLELYISYIELRYICWNYFSKTSIYSTIIAYLGIVVISIIWSVICSKAVAKIVSSIDKSNREVFFWNHSR